MRYEVCWLDTGVKHSDLQAAVNFARKKARELPTSQIVSIWSDGLILGIVADDADGLNLHKLANWPEQHQDIS